MVQSLLRGSSGQGWRCSTSADASRHSTSLPGPVLDQRRAELVQPQHCQPPRRARALHPPRDTRTHCTKMAVAERPALTKGATLLEAVEQMLAGATPAAEREALAAVFDAFQASPWRLSPCALGRSPRSRHRSAASSALAAWCLSAACRRSPCLQGAFVRAAEASDLAGAHAQAAVKHIAALLARAGIDDLYGAAEGAAASAERDEPKQLDVIAARAPESALHGCDAACPFQ